MDFAAEYRAHEFPLHSFLHDPVHVSSDAGKPLEILVDELLRHGSRNPQVARKAEA